MTQRQTLNWEVFLATSVGIFFSILLGFFVLKLVIGALTLATSYGEKDALKKFKDVLTSSIKGLLIAVGGFIVMNTIFTFLRIGQVVNPLEKLSTELRNFEQCIRDYNKCGNPLP
jgi:hypothetical protein